jgi:hypothetical protein
MLKSNYGLILALTILTSGTLLAQKDETISQERKQAIDSLALEKVRDLSKYISIIGNKKTPYSEATRVRKYFERLMALNYDKVTISWYDIHYISDLERQPDGRYVGVVTIYQKFEGTTAEGLKYKDTTKKDITIYVERKKTQIAGRMIEFWDVVLGDIRVTETSA